MTGVTTLGLHPGNGHRHFRAAPGRLFPAGLAVALMAAGVVLTIENVTDGLADAMTLNRAFVNRMVAMERIRNTAIPAPAWTNGRFNAFPSFCG